MYVRVAIALLALTGPAIGAAAPGATRYRLTFPDRRLGDEMEPDVLARWRKWLIDHGYDVAGWDRRRAYVDVIIRPGDALADLQQTGFAIVESEQTGALRDRPAELGLSGFVNPAELLAFLDAVAAEHPDITRLFAIGQTHEDRDIWCMEISDNPGIPEDEPSIQLNGLHHAREVVTPHVVMDAITFLTDGYAGGDPQAVEWVRGYKIFCIPMVNPDGSERVHGADAFHRKNMRPVCTGSNQGVDLNRNYDYHWGSGSDACERGTGSSGSTCSDTYRGPSAASEPETQAMIDLAHQERFVIAASYHSFGRFIDYPYACNDGFPDERMPEHEVIDELMHGMADGIAAVDGVEYDVYSPIAIGPVNGDDTSWYYAHNGTYAMIVEIGTSFQPSYSVGMASVARNRGGWLYLLERLGGARIDVRVADHLTGEPMEAQVELLDFVFDTDEFPRYTDPVFGRSRWLVPANATYSVRVTSPTAGMRTLQVAVGNEPVNATVLLLPNGAVLGDVEPDGDTDLADFARFQECFERAPATADCRIFDMNGDEMVSIADLPALESAFDGPQ